MTNIYTDLPKVIRITAVTDAGEFGAANCPHCGAQGRYIYHFDCADGSHAGAMKGCFAKFPKHPFVKLQEKLADKQREYSAKKWTLPSWDVEILDAINAFADGRMPEHQARLIISIAESRRDNYQKQKYGRR